MRAVEEFQFLSSQLDLFKSFLGWGRLSLWYSQFKRNCATILPCRKFKCEITDASAKIKKMFTQNCLYFGCTFMKCEFFCQNVVISKVIFDFRKICLFSKMMLVANVQLCGNISHYRRECIQLNTLTLCFSGLGKRNCPILSIRLLHENEAFTRFSS